MTQAIVAVYLKDEDFLLYTQNKKELNAHARDAFKEKFKELKDGKAER